MSEVIREQQVSKVEIREECPSVLICTYGTLRKGYGNYKFLLEGKSKYLGTFTSDPGFIMYGRRAGFPVVVPNEKGGTIVYEVHQVSDPKTLERVHSLEGCSGIPGDPRNWYDIMPITTPVGEGWIYVQPDFVTEGREESIIKTGNWLNKSV